MIHFVFDLFILIDSLKDGLGLVLTGPYDVINGSFDNTDDSKLDLIHLHSRFYYDPPEFISVIKEDSFSNGFHIGYFRYVPSILTVG